MNKKYPKMQADYENDQWRKIADRQEIMRKIGILILIIATITTGTRSGAGGVYWRGC